MDSLELLIVRTKIYEFQIYPQNMFHGASAQFMASGRVGIMGYLNKNLSCNKKKVPRFFEQINIVIRMFRRTTLEIYLEVSRGQQYHSFKFDCINTSFNTTAVQIFLNFTKICINLSFYNESVKVAIGKGILKHLAAPFWGFFVRGPQHEFISLICA